MRAGVQTIVRGSFFRGFALLTSASVLQNLIVFASAPIITRFFTPADFGIAGLVQIIEILPILLATGQYYLALGIARNRPEAVNIAALSVVMAPVVAVAILPIALFFRTHPAFLPTALQPVAPYLWVVPCIVVPSSLLFVTRLWETRQARYGALVVNRVIESGSIAIAQIGFGLLGGGPLGIIFGRLIGIVAAASHGLRGVLLHIGTPGLRSIRPRRLAAAAWRHWRFPAYQLPAQAMHELARQLLPLTLVFFYTLESVGFYWFANRLLERPALILGDNIGRVYYQHAADRRLARQPIWRLYCGVVGILFGVAVVPFGSIMLFGPQLFAFVFGDAWKPAGEFARWIAVVSFVLLIAGPSKTSSLLYGFQHVNVMVETGRAAASAVVLIGVAMSGGGELVAVGAACVTQALIILGFMTFVAIRLRKLDRAGAAAVGIPRLP